MNIFEILIRYWNENPRLRIPVTLFSAVIIAFILGTFFERNSPGIITKNITRFTCDTKIADFLFSERGAKKLCTEPTQCLEYTQCPECYINSSNCIKPPYKNISGSRSTWKSKNTILDIPIIKNGEYFLKAGNIGKTCSDFCSAAKNNRNDPLWWPGSSIGINIGDELPRNINEAGLLGVCDCLKSNNIRSFKNDPGNISCKNFCENQNGKCLASVIHEPGKASDTIDINQTRNGFPLTCTCIFK